MKHLALFAFLLLAPQVYAQTTCVPPTRLLKYENWPSVTDSTVVSYSLNNDTAIVVRPWADVPSVKIVRLRQASNGRVWFQLPIADSTNTWILRWRCWNPATEQAIQAVRQEPHIWDDWQLFLDIFREHTAPPVIETEQPLDEN